MGNSDWVIGVAFSFASSVLSTVGLIVQKKAHNQNESLPDEKKYPVILGIVCSPLWWASFIMMGLFPFPFDFFAYSFAAQSLVAPFAALTLVMNQFFAPLILKEKLYRIDIYASLVVFAGCTITTVTGNHDDETYTLDKLIDLFGQVEFIVGASLLGVIMFFMICSLSITDPRKARNTGIVVQATSASANGNEDEISERSDVEAGKVSTTVTDSSSSVVESKAKEGKGEKEESKKKSLWDWMVHINFAFRPFYYGFIAGGFGAFQNIFFKSVGVLMKSSVFDGEGGEAWSTAFPYVFIVLVIIFAVSQLSFLNKGMARYDAVLVFPLYNACYLSLSVSFGALYYQEFSTFDEKQWILFPLGMLVTMVGVIMFVFKPREKEEIGTHNSNRNSNNTSSTEGQVETGAAENRESPVDETQVNLTPQTSVVIA